MSFRPIRVAFILYTFTFPKTQTTISSYREKSTDVCKSPATFHVNTLKIILCARLLFPVFFACAARTTFPPMYRPHRVRVTRTRSELQVLCSKKQRCRRNPKLYDSPEVILPTTWLSRVQWKIHLYECCTKFRDVNNVIIF